MEFEILGSVRIRGRAQARELAGRMQRTLLSMLLAHANQPVQVNALANAMWDGRPDERFAHKLQLHVHKLRRMLDRPGRLVLTPDGYRLQVLPGELDAERFESLIIEGDDIAAQEPERGVSLIRKALGLWCGVPYGGLDIPVLADEATRLSERRLAAIELLCATELRCGRHTAMVAELTNLVHQHPLRERLHGLLMIALYRGGRQADALEAYRTARRMLVEELGIEPGPELRRIEQRILAGETVEPDTVTPPVPTPAQLPHDVRHFVGRDRELSELDSLLVEADDNPVLISAMAGTAGVGKTALAVRWAHRARTRFPDGQLYVDLHGYGPQPPVSPGDALAGFLRALGVDGAAIPQEPAERAAKFRTLLTGRRMLVVLDNARTVEQVRPLLPGSRTCFVLVTSRDLLTGLAAREGAHRIDLDRLPTAEAHNLFRTVAGARANTEPEATGALIERCGRLPLALRIAAELIKTRRGLSVAELVAELADEQGWLDLLDIDGDPHTAVRAVFSWSYQQLPPDAAQLFRLWGLHPGHDADPYALAALAGTDLRTTRRALAALGQAHLAEEDSPGRYRMHDLMRAYARECVAADEPAPQRDAAMRRLLTQYLHTTVAARFALDPRARVIVPTGTAANVATFRTHSEAMSWFEAEHAALVAAVRIAAERDEHTIAWQLTSALMTFFYLSKQWGDWIATHRTGLSAARRSGDRAGQAHILNGLGVAYSDLRRCDEAIACHREAAELYARTDSRSGEAWNLNNLGVVYDDLHRFPEAIDSYRNALRLFRELGDARGQGLALNNLGDIHRQRNEPDRAIDYLRQATEIQQQAADLDGQRFTLGSLGDLHRAAGRTAEAMDSYQRALVISRELGDRWRVAWLLDRLANLAAAIGETTVTNEYSREALAIFADFRDRPVTGVPAPVPGPASGALWTASRQCP